MQRALIQFAVPKNYQKVKKALIKAHREDLIGNGCDCLIGYAPGKIGYQGKNKNNKNTEYSKSHSNQKSRNTRNKNSNINDNLKSNNNSRKNTHSKKKGSSTRRRVN